MAAIVQRAEYNAAQQTTLDQRRVREESAGIGTSEGELMLGSQTTSVGTLDSSRKVTFVMDRAGRISVGTQQSTVGREKRKRPRLY
jgi:hypothetical protein